ncbi:MAG: fatty acid desaturase [Planctomycetota bacterium]|nr:fatty acid desaturase [Planctomycetota bacterium]
MTHHTDTSGHDRLPTLHELGDDLLRVTWAQKAVTILLPFLAMGAYAAFAWQGWWPAAVLAVMALSFVTYGSTSHDLVHRTLGLPHGINDALLSVIELFSFRSGSAYRLSHLHHHHHLLANDDVEGRPAYGSLAGAVLAGFTMQFRLWWWAWTTHPSARGRLLAEAVGIAALLVASIASARWTPVPLVYAALVIAGSWIFPLVTVYIPHDAHGDSKLTTTRLFRGWFVRLLAFDHLYHLEHHLYPAVPHHHWRRLAVRLDPHFAAAGVRNASVI